MPEKIRTFSGPFNFLNAAVEGLRQRNGWNIEVEYAGPLLQSHTAAKAARLDYESSPTLIWINPRLDKEERSFAYAWSLGIVVLTDNFSGQRDLKTVGSIATLPVYLEPTDQDRILDEVVKERSGKLLERATVFALTSGLPFPRQVITLYAQLHETPASQKDAYIGLNPKQYFRDTLKLRYYDRLPKYFDRSLIKALTP